MVTIGETAEAVAYWVMEHSLEPLFMEVERGKVTLHAPDALDYMPAIKELEKVPLLDFEKRTITFPMADIIVVIEVKAMPFTESGVDTH